MTQDNKRRQSFPLRLSPSIRQQANDLAHREGLSLNHFISLAVAEKISRLEHESWMHQQAKAKHHPVVSPRRTEDAPALPKARLSSF